MTSMTKNDIKRKTIELYDSLSQDLETRKKQTDIRDQIIELNYTFFGYIASNKFINNTSVTYEDKLQSALMHFCECWWMYRFNGDATHRGYRSDLSFAVFFKLRVEEMMERELNEVKYSIRRTLCMEVGQQLGKHWGQVKYEDLSKVDLPADKMNSLKAIFGTLYMADLETHEMFIPAPTYHLENEFENLSDEYDTVEDLLIHDMIYLEEKLTDKKLKEMSEMYQIDFSILKEALPRAERVLYERLKKSLELKDL